MPVMGGLEVSDVNHNAGLLLLLLGVVSFRYPVCQSLSERRQRHCILVSYVQATRAIRASVPEQCQPWIVAMTASVFEEDRERCFDAGMDDFLPKPFQQQTLKDILKRYLEHHSRSHVSGGGAAGDGSGGSSSGGSPDELDNDEQG